jgi:uncharacterized repeat protein (TIGR01451 family)
MGTVVEGGTFVAGLGADFLGADKFESNTYIHFFESEADYLNGTGLLQSIAYHTSCSQPINIGDETGYAKLVDYVGVDGAADVGDGYGEDADEAPGPEAETGSTVEFTMVVTNTGEFALQNVQLLDDVAGLELVEDGNGDSILDVGEQWVFTASETAGSGLSVNVATVIAEYAEDGLSVKVGDQDAAYFNDGTVDLSNIDALAQEALAEVESSPVNLYDLSPDAVLSDASPYEDWSAVEADGVLEGVNFDDVQLVGSNDDGYTV